MTTFDPDALSRLALRADSLLDASRFLQADSVTARGLRLARIVSEADSLDVASWLYRRGRLQLELQHYSRADSLFRRVCTLEEKGHPDGSENLLAARRGLFRAALGTGNLDDAESWAARALHLSRSLHGEQDAHTASDLANQALLLLRRDRPREAEALLDQAIGMIEEQWGMEEKDLIAILQSRAAIARRAGRLAEAVRFYERSAAIAELHFGPDHPTLIHPLTGLGILRRRQGEFAAAEQLLRRSLSLGIETFGPEHPRLAQLYNNLGVLLHAVGDYAGAAEAFRRCLALVEQNPDANPAHAAHTLANLASALEGLGRYAESIRRQRQAVDILETVYGPDHSRTASAVSRLADTLRKRGSPAEAEELYRRCLRATEKAYGQDHPDAASYRARIGSCLQDRGRTREAETYIADAIAIDAAVFGPENYHVALDERQMGLLLLFEGRTAAADSVLRRCHVSLERGLGGDHPGLIQCLGGLGAACLDRGRAAEAEDHAMRALDIAKRAVGAGHTAMASSRLLAMGVNAALGDGPAAAAMGIEAVEGTLMALDETFQVSSEHEAILYAELPHEAVSALVGLLAADPQIAQTDSILQAVFTLTARIHGQVLTRLAQRRQLLEMATDSTEAGHLYSDYLQAAERLANLVVRAPRGDAVDHAKEVARARSTRELAERALADASESFRQSTGAQLREQELTAQAIAARLEPGETLVQFVRFPGLAITPGSWQAGGAGPETGYLPPGADRYGAFRLLALPGGQCELHFLDLGGAAEFDSLITRYRQAIESAGSTARPPARCEAEYRTAARHLYRRIWQPLVNGQREAPLTEAALPAAAAPIVFLIPAAGLHQIDFYSLLAPDGRLVIERYRVHLLSSVRDLLATRDRDRTPGGHGILVVGNPTTPERQEAVTPSSSSGSAAALAKCVMDLTLLGTLPGAEEEVQQVADLFAGRTDEPVTVLLRTEATEDRVKQSLAGKRILHIAAHGFFCDFPAGEAADLAPDGAPAIPVNPLLRSGLVLAPRSGVDDGLLMAQELVARDLRSLEWVVLSACNSGLGRLLPGEGLSGLRRAFRIGGARTVLMALWAIPDTAARDLVERIYRHRLEGHSTLDALRLAELERMQDARTRLDRSHPLLWGGFVAEGDWR
jgi:tetratricopeptide (TPR) repeat protein/CHAT domain-containing protein